MDFLSNINKYQIILASQSPRRQKLLKEIIINFSIKTKQIDEVYPPNLIKEEIPIHLAKLKASVFNSEITDKQLIITADTIVWVNNSILGKPANYNQACKMLKTLSNNKHTVYTAVCLKTKSKTKTFWASTHVFFKKLTHKEISFYIENYKPYDKAGSYGIQEWIGYIGIEKIDGSYFNVMGLPVQKLYDELSNF